MEGKIFKGKYYVDVSERIVRSPYSRIFIKNKYPEESKYREINIKEHVLNKTVDAGIALELCEKTA